jgi:3-hydroxyisobutyrate dehydrogenase-like beta-hydroxyacid dehydrogenase
MQSSNSVISYQVKFKFTGGYTMSEVTVIGLGNMGSALARAFVKSGYSMTIWNRSAEKAGPLVEQGAVLAPGVAAAVEASPVVILCVTNPAAAQQILSQCEDRIRGKLLVQFTTSTPQEARAGEDWAQQHAAEYLQAAITGSPSSIGTPDAHILISGAEDVFHKAEPLLRILASQLDYKGAAIGLAPAWDFVMIMHYYGMFLSLFHSVQICQAEGIPLEQFIKLLESQGQGYEKWLVENIQSGNYQDTSAPLELWAGAIQRIAQHARESGIDAGFPAFAAALFEKAMSAGYGRQEVSAVFKVLAGQADKGQ